MRQKQKKKRVIFTYLFIFLVMVVCFGISYLSHHESMRITTIEVTGNTLTERYLYERIIRDELNTKKLLVLSGKNTLLYSKKKIEKRISDMFPEVKNISIRVHDWHTLTVHITEFKAYALWCPYFNEEIEVVDSANSDRCYLMNNQGVVFALQPEGDNEDAIRFFGGLDTDPLTKSYTSTEFFVLITKFIEYLKKEEIRISEVLTENNETYSLYADFGLEIRVSNQGDLSKNAENLNIILNQQEEGIKEKIDQIEYIDLRFGNRVFYKEKEVEQATTTDNLE